MPKTRNKPTAPAAWDPKVCEALIASLQALRQSMLQAEARLEGLIGDIDPAHRASARNLAHYLAFRREDLRGLQERLAWLGVSSLGRSETHVLASVDKVLGILHALLGQAWTPLEEPVGHHRGPALLARHAQALFGAVPTGRATRIMVTLPSEAATDPRLIDNLVASGMDIARINCAHDGPDEWAAMTQRVRLCAHKAKRTVKVLMDLGGPKLRTGPIEPAQAVLRLKPERNAFGKVTAPAQLVLHGPDDATRLPGGLMHLPVQADWLAQLRPGDRVDLKDDNTTERKLQVLSRHGQTVLLSCSKTAYFTPQSHLVLHRPKAKLHETTLLALPPAPGLVRLHRGDTVRLVGEGLGHGPRPGPRGEQSAKLVCTLPQALNALRKDDRVWFDDGRIGAVVRQRGRHGITLEITVARDGGEDLAADKGINLPDTALQLPALTDKDLDDLRSVARLADMVGLSFAQSADDVRHLRQQLIALGAPQMGLILKIETRRGFENLPDMLFAAMGAPASGVMIARGDLAVECGYERMAEVQEEIMWACEAAHLPVVWATQVLETLAKTGLPTRAEITDAAMGERAECVMLNKGPHILDAVRMLGDILQRMQQHQSKKRPLLRALKAWQPPQLPKG